MDDRDAARGDVLPQPGADACQQLVELERLRHVVVRAGVEPRDGVERAAACREHDDGHRRTLSAQVGQDLEAVHGGKSDVQQHEVDVSFEGAVEGLLAVLHDHSGVAGRLQAAAHEGGDARFVLDDEYASHPVASRCRTTSPARTGAGRSAPSAARRSGTWIVNVAPPPGVSVTAQYP